jgi:hypothetical protein
LVIYIESFVVKNLWSPWILRLCGTQCEYNNDVSSGDACVPRGAYFWEEKELLLVGAIVWRHQALWLVCNEWVQYVNAFRMGSSNLSFTTKSCTSASFTLQVGIILWVVEYTGWLKSLYTPDDYSTKTPKIYSFIHSEGKEPTRCDKVCSFIASTCFGHQYAHHQEYY